MATVFQNGLKYIFCHFLLSNHNNISVISWILIAAMFVYSQVQAFFFL